MKLLSTSVAGVDVLDREINPLYDGVGMHLSFIYTTSTRAEPAAWICTGSPNFNNDRRTDTVRYDLDI